MTLHWNRNRSLLRWIGRSGFRRRTYRHSPATALDTSDGTATPATPIFRPNTQRALPPTLMMFISTDTCKVIREFPMERNSAAQALYTARKGKDSAEMIR